MALQDAVAAVRSRAETLWPGIEAAVPLLFPNGGKFPASAVIPPVDDNGTPAPFVRIEVIWNGGEFVSIGSPGSNRARREGHIWAIAFIAEGSEEALAHQLAGEAARMFEGEEFSGLVCQAMQPGGDAAAERENGNYFGQAAAVPFVFDETA